MSKKYQAKVVEDADSESGLSLVFPEEALEELGWKEGDDLTWSVGPEGVVVLEKTVAKENEAAKCHISFDKRV
ncbi:hypothetical protein [Serratia sp. Se-RSBMAAmG]|uniref:hypothetical protein n=1 Tax=Serratia sp. Se-RSBMAAmG TaxID=3043305 RepID=UPI0024AF1470|nr:hypothetical protein [Serratia sp. Se-RSBMAAmG]MDI6976162.1 hypothetical protein [Serratia sp. Se-RSBMAAmG]